jgi:transketolase
LEVILIATGSEVHPTLAAGRELAREGIGVRVVSLPSWELFAMQPEEYRQQVFPAAVRKRLAVEAGVRLGWERFTGLCGAIIAMDGFGKSAPGPVLMEKFGFTAAAVASLARMLIRED